MKLSESKGGDFTPHPETEAPVRGVIVDVTPLKKRETQYGEKEEFRLVIETEVLMEEADEETRHCIWSRGYTPSLNEKAAFRKDLRKMMGRSLTAQELKEFDTETMIGMGVKLMVQHAHSEDGSKTYANIALIMPDPEPIKASGKYTRVKDRPDRGNDDASGGDGGGKSSYKKAPDSDSAREGWQSTKVHVGKHKGVDLGDLDADAVQSLIDKWLPVGEAMEKPLKADKALIKALKEVKSLLEGADEAEDEECDF